MAPSSQMMGSRGGVRLSLGTRVSPAVRGTSKGQPNDPTGTRQVVRGLARRGAPRPFARALEAPGREAEVGRGRPLDAEGLEEMLRVLSPKAWAKRSQGQSQASLPPGSESASPVGSDASRLVRRSNLTPLPLGSSLRVSERLRSQPPFWFARRGSQQ